MIIASSLESLRVGYVADELEKNAKLGGLGLISDSDILNEIAEGLHNQDLRDLIFYR